MPSPPRPHFHPRLLTASLRNPGHHPPDHDRLYPYTHVDPSPDRYRPPHIRGPSLQLRSDLFDGHQAGIALAPAALLRFAFLLGASRAACARLR